MFKIRRAVYWQFGGLAIAVALISALSRFFPIVDFVEAAQTRVMNWGTWGAICYPLLFAACNILLLPGGVLAVGGGFFFGLWWGFLIVFAGNVLGAAISFALSRWVAGRWFRRRLSRNATLRALEPALERESWKIILLSQLHPLFPASLLNYLYGLTRLRFVTYMLWASIGRMPGLFLYAYVGTLGQFGLKMMRGKSRPTQLRVTGHGRRFFYDSFTLTGAGSHCVSSRQNSADGIDNVAEPNQPTRGVVHRPIS